MHAWDGMTDTLLGRRLSIPGHVLSKMSLLHVCASFPPGKWFLTLSPDFFLIDPPPDALHKPIPPSKIVLAGDSAGAGLCITALTVLRDMGVELPAGAVLISPWVDLTHSFPSVMQNTATVCFLSSVTHTAILNCDIGHHSPAWVYL